MRSTHAIVVLLALAAAPAAAQEDPYRRPPADTIRMGAPAAEGDSIRLADAVDDAEDRTPPARPAPGTYEQPSGRGPFSVETRGRLAPRPPRGEVVYAGGAPARVASRDTARTAAAPRDTAGPTPRDTAAAAPAQTPRQGGARVRTHTVEARETFYGIARRYGVQPAQLRALNPEIDPEVLEVGDVLQLPAAARDSRSDAPAAEAAVPRGSRTHVVAAGETLFGIARRYGVSTADIVRVNRLESDQVRIGQRLVVPPSSN